MINWLGLAVGIVASSDFSCNLFQCLISLCQSSAGFIHSSERNYRFQVGTFCFHLTVHHFMHGYHLKNYFCSQAFDIYFLIFCVHSLPQSFFHCEWLSLDLTSAFILSVSIPIAAFEVIFIGQSCPSGLLHLSWAHRDFWYTCHSVAISFQNGVFSADSWSNFTCCSIEPDVLRPVSFSFVLK